MDHIVSIAQWLFRILPDIIGYFLTATGLAVIFMPEAIKGLESRKKIRVLLSVFLMTIGIGAVVSNRIQQSDDRATTQQTQIQVQKKIDDLNQNLQKEEINHASDVRYLEGRLDTLSQFGPAVLKLAQVSEENTRKQYEQKALSNKELRDYVANVVGRMRDLENRKRQARDQAMYKYITQEQQVYYSRPNPKSPPTPEMQQQINAMMNQEFFETMQTDNTFNQEFRDKIMNDAVYAREQLISRLGNEAAPKMGIFENAGLDVFQGIMAGPEPIANAADYLERFARELTP